MPEHAFQKVEKMMEQSKQPAPQIDGKSEVEARPHSVLRCVSSHVFMFVVPSCLVVPSLAAKSGGEALPGLVAGQMHQNQKLDQRPAKKLRC